MKAKKIIFLLFILFGLGFISSKTFVNAASDTSAEQTPTENSGQDTTAPEGTSPAPDENTSAPEDALPDMPSGTEVGQQPYYFYMDVSENINSEEIQTKINLEAFDDYDGNLTDYIEYDDVDNYQINVRDKAPAERVLGEYQINYTVSDNSGNTQYLVIYVIVEDTKPPVFDASSTIKYEVDIDNNTLTNEQIVEGVNANDIYDQTLTKTLTSGSIDTLEQTKDIEQTLTVTIADDSGNSIDQDVIVILRDRTAPEITADSYEITTCYINNTSVETLLGGINIVVADNYDKGVNYEITQDDYSTNKSIIGSYNVELTATDSSGNQGTNNITINVNDDIPPVFYLDISKVYVDRKVKLTSTDFLSILKLNGKIKSDDYDFFVLEDTYTESSKEEGKYCYRCRVSYGENDFDDFKFMVHVVSDKVAPTLTFFQSFILSAKKIGDLIWNILKWPISKIKKLF